MAISVPDASRAPCARAGFSIRTASTPPSLGTYSWLPVLTSLLGLIMAFKAGNPALRQRVEELEKQAASQKAQELVGLAMKDGKLSPAQKEWAVAYALSDPKGFAAFMEKAPVVVPMGKTAFAADERKQTEVDWKILKNQGVTEEDLKKYGGMEDDTDGE